MYSSLSGAHAISLHAVIMIFERVLLLLAVAVTPVLLGCDVLESPEKKAVITVGNQALPLEGLRREIRRLCLEMEVDDQGLNQVLDPLIGTIVDRLLIVAYARDEGIVISDEELAFASEEIRGDYSETAFRELLLQQTIDLDEWEEGLRRQLLFKKITSLLSENITPVASQKIKAYYDSHREEFERPPMIKFRQILRKTKKEAEAARKSLQEGKDIKQLARECSIAPILEDEDQLAWIAEGDLEKSMEKVLFSLPVGKISPVTKTAHGFHVFMVVSTRPGGTLSLLDATEEIETNLLYIKKQAQFREFLEGLRDRYSVSINQELLEQLALG